MCGGGCAPPDISKQSISVQGLIAITDSGWTTFTTSSDCATGQADDVWQLTLTQARNVTIGVEDCCCPGDYYEVRVDGNLIGTTLNLAPPLGCDFSGSLSGGSFTVPMCAGTHVSQLNRSCLTTQIYPTTKRSAPSR